MKRTKPKPDHKQKAITHPKTGEVIEVDHRLAPLLFALWDAGYETLCSCQDFVNGRDCHTSMSAHWLRLKDYSESSRQSLSYR